MTMNKPNKPMLLVQNRTIIGLHHQIAQQKRLLQTVQSLLPKQLADHVVHCVLREQKLLIYTHSAVWASQLRFYHNEILSAIASYTKQPVTNVLVRIIAEQIGETHAERKARLPTPERIAQLQQDSSHIADESLRLALLRLGSTLERLSKQ
jgi:hypothetical protein